MTSDLTPPSVRHRIPYVGDGADGARRSAQIDREEADCLDPGERRDWLLTSAAVWDQQAADLEHEAELKALAGDELTTALLDQIADDAVHPMVQAAELLYKAGRRDTPTGTIIGRLDPLTQRGPWLELRRTGIGSSDVPVLLGLSKYRSELDLYMDKRGETPDDDAGEAAMWGNVLEDPVARVWAERHGVKVRRVGTIAHVEHRHMLCDLDRYVVGCDEHERCALEVKTRSAWKADEWRDGVPEDVEAQTMHQIAVTGLDAIHVAALIGGQRLESFVVTPDADFIADLFAIEDEFWHNNVQAGVVPEISSLELLEAHLRRFTPNKGTPVHVHGAEAHKAHALAVEYDALKAGEKRLEEVKRELAAMIGADATDLVTVDDEGTEVPLFTWRAQKAAAQLDRDAMRADGVYDRYMKPAGTTRVLRRVKTKGDES